jgi:hypothetical protein
LADANVTWGANRSQPSSPSNLSKRENKFGQPGRSN